MLEIKIALVGFGSVGQALVRLLESKRVVLNQQYGFNTKLVAVATGHHGMAINPQGLDVHKTLEIAKSGQSLETLTREPSIQSIPEFIRKCGADVLFENSPVNHMTGQPAAEHLKIALESGMHAITANKGPVVHAYTDLTALAVKMNRRFLFESSVMDGAPIFSLFRGPLPAIELKGFSGILNSCTNLLLELMEQGKTFDEAVAYGKSIGITENVVDLLISKVKKLPQNTQMILKYAACIGNRFSIKLVSFLLKQSIKSTFEDLKRVIISGYIVPVNNDYMFIPRQSHLVFAE